MLDRIWKPALCVGIVGMFFPTHAIASTGDSYTVYISYQGQGTSVNASWSSRPDVEGSAILCFGPGSSSVAVCGTNPCKIRGGDWPCWENTRRRYDPEFASIVTLNIKPAVSDKIEVEGHIHRMVRTVDDTYKIERHKFNRMEDLNGHWVLALGSDRNGSDYDLDIRIEGRNPPAWSRTSQEVKVVYSLRELVRNDDSEPTVQQGRLLASPATDDASQARFEFPLHVRGVDSTVLFMQVALKDYVRRGESQLDIVFEMNRDLAMGVQPLDDEGMTTIDGLMLSSRFQKEITLTAGHKLRVRIPPQEKEKDYIETDEYIEFEWSE